MRGCILSSIILLTCIYSGGVEAQSIELLINGETAVQHCHTKDGADLDITLVATEEPDDEDYLYDWTSSGRTWTTENNRESSSINSATTFSVTVSRKLPDGRTEEVGQSNDVTVTVYRKPQVSPVPQSPLEQTDNRVELVDYLDISYPDDGEYEVVGLETESGVGYDETNQAYYFNPSVGPGEYEVTCIVRDKDDDANECAETEIIKIVVIAEPELSDFLDYYYSPPPVCENYTGFYFIANIGQECLVPGGRTSVNFLVDYEPGEETNKIEGSYLSYEDGVYKYLLKVDPSRHREDKYSLTLRPQSEHIYAHCHERYTGNIPLDPGGNPSIAGLPNKGSEPLKDGADSYLCSSSYDPLQMRGNPANGSYTFTLGYDNGRGGFAGREVIEGGISDYEPVDEPTNLKIVPAELFSEHAGGELNRVIKVEYTYPAEGSGTCPETTTRYIRFEPSADLELDQSLDTLFCYGDTVSLSVNHPNASAGDKYSWDFGDGFSSGFRSGNSVEHYYKEPGLYPFKFRSNIEDLPDSTCNLQLFDTIYIGARPVADFDVYQNFEDRPASFTSRAYLKADNISDHEDVISSWHWDFGTGYQNEKFFSSNGDTLFTYREISAAPYAVTHTVASGWGCRDSITRYVPVFPVKEPVPGAAYKESFDAGVLTGWYESGMYRDMDTVSSWENAVPSGSEISEYPEGGEAWTTSENPEPAAGYYNNESSWVESPVFDLRGMELPMISMNTKVNADNLFDGATLQYAYVNDSAFGNENWQTLGEPEQGLGWYTSRSIIGAPGGTLLGWTGDTASEWSLSAFRLNDLLPATNDSDDSSLVRFRIAFGSNADNLPGKTFNGFAFDNFYIGERNRKVVVEEFCDHENYEAELNTMFKDPQAIRMQYHISRFNTDDEIYRLNPADPGARALTYGVGKAVPRGIIDGIYSDNDQELMAWGADVFLQRSLIVSPFHIEINPAVNDGKLEVNATVDRIREDHYGPLLVQTAIVEREVTANGKSFTNVLRQLLPNAAGTRISGAYDWSNSFTVNESWRPYIQPESALMVVVFVQDEETKEIYQANYADIPAETAFTLAPQRSATKNTASLTDVYLKPNPAEADLTVTYNALPDQDYVYKVLNHFGQEIQAGTLKKKSNAATINTANLPAGMYYLVVEAVDDKVIKRFVVVK